MDLVIYVLFIITAFGFGILTVKDRIFGIIGILIGFVGASALYSDGTLTLYRIFDPASQQWQSFSITGSIAIWIEVGVIVIDFIILYSENQKYKVVTEY